MIIEINATSRKMSEYAEKLADYGLQSKEKSFYIEIQSVEDIVDLSFKLGWDIIVSNKFKDDEPYLEIYDDYRE